jgi:hypothetical protein
MELRKKGRKGVQEDDISGKSRESDLTFGKIRDILYTR